MFKIRKSNQRGVGEHGWLHSKHSFSFAEYYDRNHMGFRSLRVINEDKIDGGTGFGTHPHRDMEIISYVMSGALEHQDSMGNIAVIKPEEVQRMSAGSGILHSEYNKMPDQQTHFLQIWIKPNQHGGNPSYAQKSFSADLSTKNKVLVISQDGREGSLPIKQDADLYISRLKADSTVDYNIRAGRALWTQVTKGSLKIISNSETIELNEGDGLSVENVESIHILAMKDSELLVFDLL